MARTREEYREIERERSRLNYEKSSIEKHLKDILFRIDFHRDKINNLTFLKNKLMNDYKTRYGKRFMLK